MPVEDEATITLHELSERLELDEELGEALAELPEGMGMLVVRKGPIAGSRFILDDETTALGRHPDSDIFLDDITVSRRHAVVRRAAAGYEVSDVGSLNGTYVDHERVDTAAAAPPGRSPDRALHPRVPARHRGGCVSPEAPHLSIGEVLAQLRDEFPDITISKIRFLESQGLIDPERTPSGYRKFYDDDLVRLRWILFQQKEHFLPLKVIKERLDELPPGDLSLLDPASALDLDPGAAPDVEGEAPGAPAEPEPEPSPAPAAAPAPAAPAPAPPADRPAGPAPARTPPRRPSLFAAVVPLDDGPPDDGVVSNPGGRRRTYSREELAQAAGLELDQVAELESFGLVSPAREESGEPRFDDDALEVAKVAAGFFARGVEARHLRMYRTFAEREAVLFGQVLLPYTRQRNPDARARLQEELVELATLGRRLRTALLRDAARETLAE